MILSIQIPSSKLGPSKKKKNGEKIQEGWPQLLP
jgi:hypothetical protein